MKKRVGFSKYSVLLLLVIGVFVIYSILNINFKPTGQVVSETQTTAKTNSYVYANGLVASYDSDGNEKYYINDHLGGTSKVIDKNGNAVASDEYYAFGEEKLSTGDEKFTYTGKELDDTGLYYYGARYYDAGVGRFISPDPLAGGIENPQSLNRYAYTLNNPMKYVDPSGMDEARPDATGVASSKKALKSDLESKNTKEKKKIPSYSEFVQTYPTRREQPYYYEPEGDSMIRSSPAGRFPTEIMDMHFFCEFQTCADVPFTIYLEYQKLYADDVIITLNRGETIKWSEWENNPESKKTSKDWKGFMKYVFIYAGSESIKRFSKEVKSVDDLQPGDLLVYLGPGESYGHTQSIKSVEYSFGNKYFRVFSGTEPTRDAWIRTLHRGYIQQELQKGMVVLRRFQINIGSP